MSHSLPRLLSYLYIGFMIGLANFSSPAAALEPTPSTPTDEPPEVTPAEVLEVAPQIIIKYRDPGEEGAQNLTQALESAQKLSQIADADLVHVRLMSDNAQVVSVTNLVGQESVAAQGALQEIADRIAADPAVEYAEPDVLMQIQQAVNDPQYAQQWHYSTPGTGVNIEGGWALAEGFGVIVAVIDTGYRPHVDLAANLLPGFDFISNTLIGNDGNARDADASDPGDWISASDNWCPISPRNSSWHGTHVAGTVAAVTDNATGVAGTARAARVVPVRVLGKCGGNLSDIVDGMRWAAGLSVVGVPNNPNPARVLNLSLGGSGACGPSYQSAIDDIVAAGSTVVVAAGNSNANASNFRPANCNGVITVAATNRVGARSYYSNFGSTVEVAAPGGETFSNASDGVLSTLNSGTTVPVSDNYAFYQGTSMATPHVAGIAALLYQLDPSITPATISTTLQATAQPFPTVTGNQCTTANCGAGIVDAGAATAAVQPSIQAADAMPWLMLLLKP